MTEAKLDDVLGTEEEFKKASPNEGVYLLAGSYPRIRIDALKLQKSARKKNVTNFIAEFTILESNVPERPAGTHASWVCSNEHASFLSNVKGFIAKLSASPFESVTRAATAAAVGDAQPMKGSEVSCLVTLVSTKTTHKDGNGNVVQGQYSKHSWTLLNMSPKMTELSQG